MLDRTRQLLSIAEFRRFGPLCSCGLGPFALRLHVHVTRDLVRQMHILLCCLCTWIMQDRVVVESGTPYTIRCASVVGSTSASLGNG